MQFYKMNRRGEFKPYKFSANQCKEFGHKMYYYEVQLIFPVETPLDKDGFLIDHFHVDEFIQKIPIWGSCEEMHRTLFTAFQFMQPRAVAYKFTIKPSLDPDALAYMDYIHADEPHLFSLLK